VTAVKVIVWEELKGGTDEQNMGTDIYLEWEGKTEAEMDAQMEGSWSIDAGGLGYLRASIGMMNENAVLRALFPEKYWSRRSTDEYDFKAGYEMLNVLGMKYLMSAMSDKPMDIGMEHVETMNRQEQSAMAIHGALTQLADRLGASEKFKVYVGAVRSLGSAVEWLNSLFKFFELGMEKQDKGLKPYPHISW